MVEVNQIKDDLAEQMKLKWYSNKEEPQPAGFMNFPIPSGGAYTYKDFFSHFEAEHRIIDKNADGNGVSSRWVKKSSAAQNHLWDCRVYNIVLKDIITAIVCKDLKLKTFAWKDYVDIILKRY